MFYILHPKKFTTVKNSTTIAAKYSQIARLSLISRYFDFGFTCNRRHTVITPLPAVANRPENSEFRGKSPTIAKYTSYRPVSKKVKRMKASIIKIFLLVSPMYLSIPLTITPRIEVSCTSKMSGVSSCFFDF